MASTVTDLAVNLRTALVEYSAGQLWIFIESAEWKAFLSGCEDLMAFLEFSGHSLTASRVFQGLTDVVNAVQDEDRDMWLEDCYVVQQKVAALLMRLNAISRSWNQLRPDSTIPTAPDLQIVSQQRQPEAKDDFACDIGLPQPDQSNTHVVKWMGKRLYLGTPHGRVHKLFQLLVGRLNYPICIYEIQRHLDGFETSETVGSSPKEIRLAKNRLRKDVSTLRSRLREHNLDDHVDLACQDAKNHASYTLLVRGRAHRMRQHYRIS